MNSPGGCRKDTMGIPNGSCALRGRSIELRSFIRAIPEHWLIKRDWRAAASRSFIFQVHSEKKFLYSTMSALDISHTMRDNDKIRVEGDSRVTYRTAHVNGKTYSKIFLCY